MDLTYLTLDVDRIVTFRDAILDLHVQGIYASGPRWFTGDSLDDFRRRWVSTPQPKSFLAALTDSVADPEAIAEVWLDGDAVIGFLWVLLTEVEGYGITMADVHDVSLQPDYRGRGLGKRMIERAAALAKDRGAAAIRGDTGAGNAAARRAIEAFGGIPTRMIYEFPL